MCLCGSEWSERAGKEEPNKNCIMERVRRVETQKSHSIQPARLIHPEINGIHEKHTGNMKKKRK